MMSAGANLDEKLLPLVDKIFSRYAQFPLTELEEDSRDHNNHLLDSEFQDISANKFKTIGEIYKNQMTILSMLVAVTSQQKEQVAANS